MAIVLKTLTHFSKSLCIVSFFLSLKNQEATRQHAHMNVCHCHVILCNLNSIPKYMPPVKSILKLYSFSNLQCPQSIALLFFIIIIMIIIVNDDDDYNNNNNQQILLRWS